MRLVVDANIVISAVLRKSTTQKLVFDKRLDLCSPIYLMEEIEEHREELRQKAGYGKDKFDEVLGSVLSNIQIAPVSEYAGKRAQAKELVPDQDDAPYVWLFCFRWAAPYGLKTRSCLILP